MSTGSQTHLQHAQRPAFERVVEACLSLDGHNMAHIVDMLGIPAVTDTP